MGGHHILGYFPLFYVYFNGFRLKLISFKKNLKTIQNFEHIEYIWDKIIPITKFEKSHIYFKIKVFFGFFG